MQTKEKIAFEEEMENSMSIEELEQRLEMVIYCCDFDKDRPDRLSCGVE